MNIKQSISRIFTIILLVLAWVGTANAAADSWEYGLHNKDFKFSGGSGTHSDPYIIGNAQDLADLAYLVTEKNDDVTGKYFKQTADITLNDFEVSDNIYEENINAKEWTPIGEYGFWRDDDFQGFYDGGGHYISGLYFGEKAAERYYIGLFGSCEDAIISNLTLKNVYIDNLNSSVYSYIGALVGYSMSSTFNNVRVESCKILISPNKSKLIVAALLAMPATANTSPTISSMATLLSKAILTIISPAEALSAIMVINPFSHIARLAKAEFSFMIQRAKTQVHGTLYFL